MVLSHLLSDANVHQSGPCAARLTLQLCVCETADTRLKTRGKAGILSEALGKCFLYA